MIQKRNIVFILFAFIILGFGSCKEANKKDTHAGHRKEKVEYTCPMHPQIIRDAPGTCPICGMDLVRKETEGTIVNNLALNALIRPTNEYVISSVPVTTIQYRSEPMEIKVLGYTAYNTSSVGTISARVSGRIERLHIKYRYQKISKGQKILDIYSPELMTAQENLLFLLKNDVSNRTMIEAAKQKLLLLGMSQQQVSQVISIGKPSLTISVYSNYTGHIHEAISQDQVMKEEVRENETMNGPSSQTTAELNLKEGMYVGEGQTIFSVFDPNRLWAILNIYQEDQPFIKVGDKVRIVPEANPDNDFRTTINYIEPVFREGSKTVTARVNINGNTLHLPVGSQVKATIFSKPHAGWWLPKESILTLGMDKVVFIKKDNGFEVRKIITGHFHSHWVQINEGLGRQDSVAMNAQFLIDSESFIGKY